MARNRREPEEEGSGYSWMDTYGDLVTLLLCFFVLLYSFSSIDSQKWQQLVDAFSGSSSSAAIDHIDPGTAMAPAIPDIVGVRTTAEPEYPAEDISHTDTEEAFDQLYHSIQSYIEEYGLGDSLSVSRLDDVISLRFVELILFESGKAEILDSGKETLSHIINLLDINIDAIKMINIEGHTDNLPIHTSDYRDNWELSLYRAYNTLSFFINSGRIDLKKLACSGYGELHPIDSNDTAEGRARNRRVDFFIERAD